MHSPKIDRIEDDGSRAAHTLVETAKIDALFAALGLERPENFDPMEALRLDIVRLQDVARLWSEACVLARVHCPVEVGESHIHQGIPRLAAKLAALTAAQGQTALIRGLPLPTDLEAALVRLWQWTQEHGQSVDPVEQGLRAARKRVEGIIGPWMQQHPECSVCRRRHGSEVQHACE